MFGQLQPQLSTALSRESWNRSLAGAFRTVLFAVGVNCFVLFLVLGCSQVESQSSGRHEEPLGKIRGLYVLWPSLCYRVMLCSHVLIPVNL